MPHVLSFDLSEGTGASQAYHALLVSYLEARLKPVLGHAPDRMIIDQILQKSGHRFAYVAFIAERIEQKHLRIADLPTLASGDAIYREWLRGLDGIYGRKRADALRWLLALLVAGEAAQAWVLGEGMIPDPVGGASLVQFNGDGFEGFTVDTLAQLTRQFDGRAEHPADRYDPQLVLDLQELQGALWIARPGDGTSRYRIALKEFGPAAEADPQMHPMLALAAAAIAAQLLDTADALQEAAAADPAVETSPADEALFAELLPYLGGAIAGAAEADRTTLTARRQAADIIRLIWTRARNLQDRGFLERTIRWGNLAIAEILSEEDRPAEAAAEQARKEKFAGILLTRGAAKLGSATHGPKVAIADLNYVIKLQEDWRQEMGRAWLQSPKMRSLLADAYTNRGSAKAISTAHGAANALPDFDRAIELQHALGKDMDNSTQHSPDLFYAVGLAYMNRGNVKKEIIEYGVSAAIQDFDVAITIQESLCKTIEASGHKSLLLRNRIATAYSSRGVAKQESAAHGAVPAIADFDSAIELQEAVREDMGVAWDQSPELRNDLAGGYLNRGNAKQESAAHGAVVAIADYDAAIHLREALRRDLGANWLQNPALRNYLALAYMNRGNAKYGVAEYGAKEAVSDHDRAIELFEALREDMGATWQQSRFLRENLAEAYMNRGSAKRGSIAYGPAEAVVEYDTAIILLESLCNDMASAGKLGSALRIALTLAYLNRGSAKLNSAAHGAATAIDDYNLASQLLADMRHDMGEARWSTWTVGKNLQATLKQYRSNIETKQQRPFSLASSVSPTPTPMAPKKPAVDMEAKQEFADAKAWQRQQDERAAAAKRKADEKAARRVARQSGDTPGALGWLRSLFRKK